MKKTNITIKLTDGSQATFNVRGDNLSGCYANAKVDLACQLGFDDVEKVRPLIKSWSYASGLETNHFKVRYTDAPEQKVRMELIPLTPLIEVGRVLTLGADKYGDSKWEDGVKWSKIIGSIFRHFTAVCMGEDKDPDTGCYHLAHVITNALFLLQYMMLNKGEDDRRKHIAEGSYLNFKIEKH